MAGSSGFCVGLGSVACHCIGSKTPFGFGSFCGLVRDMLFQTGVITAHSSGGAPIHVKYKNLSATTTALVQRGETAIPQSFNADITQDRNESQAGCSTNDHS